VRRRDPIVSATSRRVAVWSLGLTAALLLAGCSGTSPGPAHDNTVKAGDKTFTGAWAQEYAQQYRRSGSEFVKKILADGKITEAEFSEVTEKYSTCLAAAGITFQGRRANGSTDFFFPNGVSADAANSAADACGRESGEDAVGGLYLAQHRNPQHLDEATIMAACLVKKEAVPRGYDAGDYSKDSPQGAFPFTDPATGQRSLEECSTDPLGLTMQKQ